MRITEEKFDELSEKGIAVLFDHPDYGFGGFFDTNGGNPSLVLVSNSDGYFLRAYEDLSKSRDGVFVRLCEDGDSRIPDFDELIRIVEND